MAKKFNKKDQKVRIKKLRANYRFTYDYIPRLNEFIKNNLPKEHWKVHIETVYDGGSGKDQWSRDVREFSVGKVISFLVDNNMKFEFDSETVTEDDLNTLRAEYKARQVRLKEILKEKVDGLDISDMDFSDMLIEPYNYQKQAIRFFELNEGNVILADQPGVGKEAGLDTLISTPEGWVRMGDIEIGHVIHNRFGGTSKVTGIFPQGIKDSYKITFNDGSFTYCGLEHLWTVRDKNRRQRNKGWTIKSLKELLDMGVEDKTSPSRAKTNRKPSLKWEIPVTEPVFFEEKKYVIDPYIMGMLIGDGCLTGRSPCISIPDSQIETVEIIESKLNEGFHLNANRNPQCPQYYITRKGVYHKKNDYKKEVENLNLNVKSGSKFIPEKYMKGSVEQRVDLLKGLMDSDGSCLKNRSNYHTTSKELAMDVVELVQSLGGIAKVNKYDRSKENKPTEYRVSIKVYFCPFNIKLKADEWSPVKSNKISRYIKSIDLEKEEEQQCIAVDSEDNTYLTDQYIVTHNTAPAFSYAHKHNLKTLIVCPSSLKLNWKSEIKKFIGKDSFIYKYNPPKRSRNVNYPKEDCQFHIINYESLDTYFKYEYKHKCKAPGCKFELINLDTGYKKCPHCKTPASVKSRKSDVVYFEDKQKMVLDPEEYDLIILDECHYIKNPQAKRTAIVKKVFADVPRKILISGTPIKNRPYEFFSILNFIKPKEFNNAHEFGKRYGAGFQDKFGWKYDGASNLEELYERVQPFLLRRLKKDVLELPAKTFVNIPVELSAKQMNEYKKIEENVVEQLNGEDNDGEVKTKLQIILELKRYISEIKVKECIPIVQDMIDQGEKIVVFSEFRNTAEMIKEKFGDRAVLLHGGTPMEDRNNAVEAFQRKDDDVMVFSGTIGAAGVGLTLTRASNLIFIGSAWSPSDMEQAEDRVHRASTTSDKVTIMKLIVEDTIDEAIEELLYEKSMIVGKTLDNSTSKKEVETVGSGGSIIGDLIDRILNG